MPTTRKPRKGSMQYWPRVRAKRIYPRVRTWPESQGSLLGFAGYKVAMTHLIYQIKKKIGKVKTQDVFCPVTIIECPPLKTASIRFYKNNPTQGQKLVGEIFALNLDKELGRKISLPKKTKKKVEDIADYDFIRLGVFTQPKLTSIGKKKPELFEIPLGGSKEEQLKFAQERLGKEIKVDEVFKEGISIDVSGITKGKGFQGPVKRFGISIRSHKSEKTKRGPGTLGGWKSQGHTLYRIAHAGRMGFSQRLEKNKWLIKISDKPDDINPKGGFKRYGQIKNSYLLVKGALPGPTKRMLVMTFSRRKSKKIPAEMPPIMFIKK
jgi:large subunit ribosomal protein L3